jgi:hypothetical protein
MVKVLVWPAKIELGLKLHVLAEEGHKRVILPLKFVLVSAAMVKVADVLPISTGVAVGEVSVKAARPVPVSATLCGLPVALSEMLKVPLRVPVAVGLKVTLTVQLCCGFRTYCRAAQVSVSE